jgi:phage-related protein
VAQVEIEVVAKDAASGILSKVTGSLGRMFEVAGGFVIHDIFGGIAHGIGELAGKAKEFGIESILAAARVEEMATVNAVLAERAGLSKEAVQEAAKSVQKMGIEAATSQEVIAEFIRAQLDVSKAADIARVAQDAAIISGINSSEATNRIVEGIVKLNPLILRNAGIVVDLDEAYKKMAEQLGINVKDLTTSQRQQAALNAVMEAGANIAGAYEAAMSEPGKVLRSFPRYFNDIQVAIGKPFQDAFGNVIFAAADLAKWFAKAVQEGGPLYPVLKSIADKATELSGKLRDIVNSIVAGDFDAAKEKFLSLFPPQIAGIIGTVIGGIESLMSALGGAGGGGIFSQLPELLSVFAPLLPLVSGIGGIFMQSLLPAFTQLAQQLAPIVQQFLPVLVQMLSSTAMTVLNALLPPFVQLITTILPVLMSLLTPLLQTFGQLVAALAPLVGTILNVLVTLILQLVEAFMPLVQAILPVLVQLISVVAGAFTEIISAVLPPLIDLVMMVVNAFLPLIQAVLPLLANLLQVVVIAITPLIAAILPVLVKLIELLVTALVPLINLVLPQLTTLFGALSNWLEAKVIPAAQKLAGWLNEHLKPALEGVTSAIQTAIEWLSNLWDKFNSSIKLPEWLTPGSPTPFEIGLRGIADALQEVSDTAMPAFQSSLALAPAGVNAPAAAFATPQPVTVVLNYSPALSLATQEEAQRVLLPFIQRGIRDAQKNQQIR